MKKCIIYLILVLLMLSCSKEASKQFSYWTIDGKEYASNNVSVSTNKTPITSLSSHGRERFDIIFFTRSLPSIDSIELTTDTIGYHSGKAKLYMYLDTISYKPSLSEPRYLMAERINGKVRYTLPSMWFVNYYNPNDSVLIEGTFNEP